MLFCALLETSLQVARGFVVKNAMRGLVILALYR